MIHLNQSGTFIDGYIKCRCKSAIKLPFHLNTKSFQLSHYFKYLKHSLCSMMKKKRQELKKNSNLSHNINQNNILPSLNDEINFNEDSMNNLNENSQITTNKPISTYSDSSKEKRPTSSLLDSAKRKKYLSL
ncbi:unnamed protein product [Rotaria socialis]|uniref:Uncharacterized protein n=1 Tax=Rotaria socialis TaxID=392032 RepID=A0A821TXB9_9BILA|nr:unnamed protein product [Rotaria socialis]CAF3623572.1 unnamed protein product [Rotaria socialis]CAF4569482.1 unnamed protein product [Rotaria socialis]CAF4883429.1 unnamed protein product [Rotaria socialis]